METKQTLDVLRKAALDALPETIDSKSAIPVGVVQELIDSGHLTAVDASSFDGPAFAGTRITTSGREHLRVLEEREKEASFSGKASKHLPAALKWVLGIIAALLVAYIAKRFIG